MSLLQMSISAGILIIIILLLHALAINRLPKRTFLILWDIVLIRLLLPVSLPTSWRTLSPLPATTVPSKALTEWIPGENMTENITENITKAADALLPSDSLPVLSAETPISVIAILWFAGCAGLALYFFLSYLRCYREFAMSLPVKQEFVTAWQKNHPLRRHYRIRQTDCISSPLTYGIFRPVILLPKNTDWTDTEHLNYVLLHEWTHIRHMDALRKMIFIGTVCIHWFNPLVWLMYQKAGGDMELFCDEGVLQQMKGDCRTAYATTLIQMEEQKILPAAMCFGGAMTQQRVVAIMKTKKTSFFRLVISAGLVLSIMICFVTSASAASAASASSASSAAGQSGASGTLSAQQSPVGTITGTWKLDGIQTEQHLRQYSSLQEMFGTGVGTYGAELTIQDNLSIQFWIGIGPVYNGTLQTKDAKIYSAVVEDSQHLIADPQQVTLYLTNEAGTTWLVTEFIGEALYWSQTN